MKTLRYLALAGFLAFSGTAFAGHLNSTLVFHHQSYVPVIVELNYVRYPYPRSEFTFHDLTPGRHYLRVFGHTGPYNVHGEPLFYKGYIDIPAAATVTAELLYNRTIRIMSIVPHPVYAPVSNCEPAPYPEAPAPCYTGLDPQRYDAIKASIAARSFDSTRLNLAKQAIRSNNMNSEQIAGLVRLLSFDSSRLDLAKFAYRYTEDPENYFLLYDLFAFDSSVRQLSDYIARFG